MFKNWLANRILYLFIDNRRESEKKTTTSVGKEMSCGTTEGRGYTNNDNDSDDDNKNNDNNNNNDNSNNINDNKREAQVPEPFN